MGALYISHDLSLIRQMCDRTSVMYLGKVVERGPTERLVKGPKHPTRGRCSMRFPSRIPNGLSVNHS